jgi:thiamine biosynthesis lipoprotein
MPSSSDNPVVERARPLLGTLVAIRVSCDSQENAHGHAHAHAAINSAFDEIALVHRSMSFHDPSSDVSRMNRESIHHAVPVHPLTFEVLETARELAARSNGCFDVTIGAELTHWGFLPLPSQSTPSHGSWRDIELLAESRSVRFHRPLWIDLGGIAKGYAVDRATQRLREQGVTQTVVNAGGDLRVQGPSIERVRLAVDHDDEDGDHSLTVNEMSVLELQDGSVASSYGLRNRRWHAGAYRGPHVDASQRIPAPTDRFVCVIAPTCMIADALTKVVMTQGGASAGLLQHYGATAHLHDVAGEGRGGWQTI